MKAKKANDTMTATRNKASRRRTSPILAAVHESISGLHSVGAVSLETMREFDALCLRPVVELAAEQISALRLREHVSQPVFARYLNVSKSSISQWESGAKKPNGAALKLLNIVQSKGLKGFRRPLVFRGKPTIPRQLSPFAVPSVKKPRFE